MPLDLRNRLRLPPWCRGCGVWLAPGEENPTHLALPAREGGDAAGSSMPAWFRLRGGAKPCRRGPFGRNRTGLLCPPADPRKAIPAPVLRAWAPGGTNPGHRPVRHASARRARSVLPALHPSGSARRHRSACLQVSAHIAGTGFPHRCSAHHNSYRS